jgi:hypothetical protein
MLYYNANVSFDAMQFESRIPSLLRQKIEQGTFSTPRVIKKTDMSCMPYTVSRIKK